uniref:Uncharacterized protein n=1 Tax=Lepeophtheirus salmonis TaxID=72036 RepID=A0A0K2TPG2_LEPSM
MRKMAHAAGLSWETMLRVMRRNLRTKLYRLKNWQLHRKATKAKRLTRVNVVLKFLIPCTQVSIIWSH